MSYWVRKTSTNEKKCDKSVAEVCMRYEGPCRRAGIPVKGEAGVGLGVGKEMYHGVKFVLDFE